MVNVKLLEKFLFCKGKDDENKHIDSLSFSLRFLFQKILFNTFLNAVLLISSLIQKAGDSTSLHFFLRQE